MQPGGVSPNPVPLQHVPSPPAGAPNADSHKDFDYEHDPNWRIFRIMAEFVDGFDFLAQFNGTVSVFGSARTNKQDPYYVAARALASRIAAEGYTVVTGGGPGIMEAANEGAKAAGGESVGLNIELPTEQRINPYVTKAVGFEHFFTRKVMLSFAAQTYIFFPGGYGTLDELFEMVTLIETKKIEDHIPVVLFGHEYWDGLLAWLRTVVYEQHRAIDERDLALLTVTDDIEEVVRIVKASKSRSHHI
ncbi:TIGR00730 family Rossman fold protein [Candidatus Berkelbacteria bacterium]|nr:TIGR00730 family Rossman fold protein [Candidatus Berkelbacteria bacterium]